MKTRNVLLLGAAIALGYFYWNNWRKKNVKVADLTNKNPLGSGAAPTEIPAVDVTVKKPVTADDLTNKNAYRNQLVKKRVKNPRAVIPPPPSGEKAPVYLRSENAVPNTNSTNIGKTVERDRLVEGNVDYQNFMGDTTNIQCACKKNKSTAKIYKSSLPQLP
jgi:hypothetical protein